jgi:hypothetical protein
MITHDQIISSYGGKHEKDSANFVGKLWVTKLIIIIILMYCNNFNGKYRATVNPNCRDHPGIRITGVRFTEGPKLDY